MNLARLSFIFALALAGVVGVGVYVWAGCGACGPAAAPSGAKPGIATTTPFNVLDVTGPAKGEKLCYICRYGGRPSVVIFTRTTTGHFVDLVKAVDKFVADHKEQRAAAFAVLLGEDNAANREALTKLAADHKLSIPLTIAADGAKGPSAYKLDSACATLALVANKNKVEAAFTVKCDAASCDNAQCSPAADVVAAADRLIGGH
ncbi:MAG TPA: hypothetical protein PLE19_07695 [Planctomycetota bacterium]|nr:hypothetical protein [Planctomycetota bacterium]HRR78934.1 hypothetical protein [Planctomycetota bacterium]HRT92788.1 hypothetical protein [Planctomycetota bacterium]